MKLLSVLVQFSLMSSHFPSCLSAAKAVCCLANKLEDNDEFRTLIKERSSEIWTKIIDTTQESEKRLSYLSLWLWVCFMWLISS